MKTVLRGEADFSSSDRVPYDFVVSEAGGLEHLILEKDGTEILIAKDDIQAVLNLFPARAKEL